MPDVTETAEANEDATSEAISEAKAVTSKVYGAPRPNVEDEVRRMRRSIEMFATLPSEVARLRKELEVLKTMPRDLARSEGACAAARRGADNRLHAIEQVQHRLTEALAAWKASRQEIDALGVQVKKSAEALAALTGMPRELSAAAEAWKSAEGRFETRLQELEAAGRASTRAHDEAGQRWEACSRSLEALRGEMARLQGLPQRLEEEGQAGNARQREDAQRFSALEAQARDLDRRAGEMEKFTKDATRHLEGILQKVADALPDDALGRLCTRLEELERRLARLEFRK